MSDEEQSVAATPDETAPPVSEESGAQDLETLLSEYESDLSETEESSTSAETSEIPAKGQGERPEDVKSAVEYVKQLQQEEINRKTNQSIEDAVSTIRGELEQPLLPDRAIKGIIYEMAETNKAFVKAFQQREKHPDAWQRILKAVGADINKDLKEVPSPTLTDDRNALASAVQSASSKAPEADSAPDYGRMSDADFAKHKRELKRGAAR